MFSIHHCDSKGLCCVNYLLLTLGIQHVDENKGLCSARTTVTVKGCVHYLLLTLGIQHVGENKGLCSACTTVTVKGCLNYLLLTLGIQ